MIKIENVEVTGWEHAIRGMRNPMNSWDRSDSHWNGTIEYFSGKPEWEVGSNDMTLMRKLTKAGTEHRKYLRMIVVYLDITAPLYWWKEFDTYKVGTVADSCSTMHKIAAKEFTIDDFSHEHILSDMIVVANGSLGSSLAVLNITIDVLNHYRELYLQTKDKEYWWQMIQLLPTSYNQKRTIMLNYEVLANIYRQRKGHKLDEWNDFCHWIEGLPYSELITGISGEYEMPSDEELEDIFQKVKSLDPRLSMNYSGWKVFPTHPTEMVIGLITEYESIFVLWSFDFSKIKKKDIIPIVEKFCKEHEDELLKKAGYSIFDYEFPPRYESYNNNVSLVRSVEFNLPNEVKPETEE